MSNSSEVKSEVQEAFEAHVLSKFGGTYEFQMCVDNVDAYFDGYKACFEAGKNVVQMPMDPIKFLRAKAGSDKIIVGHMVNGRAELYIGNEFQYMELLFLKDMFNRRVDMAGDAIYSNPVQPT